MARHIKGGMAEDPAGLIYEAYRIDGITRAECRTIFLDFVLGVPREADLSAVLARLHAAYAPDHPDHPMTQVLAESLASAGPARRRGGRASRRGRG